MIRMSAIGGLWGLELLLELRVNLRKVGVVSGRWNWLAKYLIRKVDNGWRLTLIFLREPWGSCGWTRIFEILPCKE